MPIVVDGALFRTGPTESDPTRPANVRKNLSQPDPLKLINVCIYNTNVNYLPYA